MKIRKRKAHFHIEYDVHFVDDRQDSHGEHANYDRICEHVKKQLLGKSVDVCIGSDADRHESITALAVITNVRRTTR